MIDLLVPTTAQGLLWAVMALGVYITYRVLDVADLTVEGSFPLGAAVAASMLAAGFGPIPSFIGAAVAGMLAGVVTAILHTKMKIPALLAGILTMIALYSVNLRVMGKANLSLLGTDTTFTIIRNMFGLNSAHTTLVVGVLATVLVAVFMYWFFGTEIGAAIRATGFNQQMIRAQGVNTDVTIMLGLLISNALVAISGALVAQSNGFADVGIGYNDDIYEFINEYIDNAIRRVCEREQITILFDQGQPLYMSAQCVDLTSLVKAELGL